MEAMTSNDLEFELKCYAIRFRNYRKKRKLTQEELSQRANVSAQYISKIEHGKCSPSLEISARLANALGVQLATILTIPNRENFVYSTFLNDEII